MGSRDSWVNDIKCPKCDRTGQVSEWQEDGWSFVNNSDTTISSVSEGFVATKKEYSTGEKMPVKCTVCDVFAEFD